MALLTDFIHVTALQLWNCRLIRYRVLPYSYINRIAAPDQPGPRFFGNPLVLGSYIVLFGGAFVTSG